MSVGRETGTWSPPLDEGLRADALRAALLLGERCVDVVAVRRAYELSQHQTLFPLSVHWDPVSLAQGDAGQALLAAHLAQVDGAPSWEVAAREFAERAAAVLRAGRRVAMGSVGGSAGLLLLARHLPAGPLEGLVPELRARVAEDALATAASIRGRHGMSVGAFDLISGVSGVLICSIPREGEGCPPVVPFLVRALCALAEEDAEPPGWFTPPSFLYDDEQRHLYPHGNVNLGLAHGIPGPLAALSLAVRAGVAGDEAVRAIQRWGDWLVRHATVDEGGPGWQTVVTLDRAGDRLVEVPPRGVGRDAWCYGTPGAARALFLASEVADRAEWRQLAVDAMAAVYRRPVAERAIDSPAFCHGVAGLLQITLRFHRDTGLPLFAHAAEELTRQILAAVDADRPVGIAALEPGDNPVDQPGLLDGAAGVSLVLAGAGTDTEPTWDRLFGLS